MELPDLTHWPIDPTRIERIPHGFTNESYAVDAREGQYVLRVHRGTAEPKAVRDEHHLLGLLAAQELPFQTPSPVRTTTGDTLAVLETADGPRLAELFFRIPGEPASATVHDAHLAGRALGQLDTALARLEIPVRLPRTLREFHPLVPDPIAALDDLELGADHDRMVAIFERVIAARDALVTSLPRQVVHADFTYPNVLVDGDVVTGFLDFELAEGDVRAADLACAILLTIVRTSDEQRWPLLDSLISGYRRALPLDPAEAAAIPDLVLRRSVNGTVHWIGRWRFGRCARDEPLARVKRNLMLSAWLDANGPRLALSIAGAKLPARR